MHLFRQLYIVERIKAAVVAKFRPERLHIVSHKLQFSAELNSMGRQSL